jgi:hypothetical protein
VNVCAACGAVQKHRLIVCENCNKPLVFQVTPLDQIIKEDLLGKDFAIDRKLFSFLNRSLIAQGYCCLVTLLEPPFVSIKVMDGDDPRALEKALNWPTT